MAADPLAALRKLCRLGGLPLHPLLVHFPVAFLCAAPLLDALALSAWAAPVAELQRAAFWLLAAGLLTGVVAAFCGWVDYLGLPPQGMVERTARRHLWSMVGVLVLTLVGLLLRRAGGTPTDAAPLLAFAAALAALGLLAWGGHLGAVLVFRHGIGRTSL